ncbi:Potassium channel [Stygiomarasmius scandens]|uniref:Potassium channel n=1 Tax=Marasmiellus scandens TaxID=2682957 RepID=A0ABR1IS29_9AGAR
MSTLLSTTNESRANDDQQNDNRDEDITGHSYARPSGTHNNNEDQDEVLDELDDDDDGSTERSMTLMSSFSKSSPTWWTRFKEFLYPSTDEDDLSVSPNYRYTPIISGVVIPFSILLEIPGLTEHWYIRTVGNKTVETQPNPALLDVGLGLSMGCALIANIALIIRFLEKRVKTMTLICVVFLTIHDVINITAVTIFGVEHRFDDGFTYGQSFWMTVCSTVASTVTNATLIFDLVRTPDFANSGSGLTRKQRSLIIIVIVLLCYIAFGALIHCVMTDLNFIDALYFTVCSIETIGFGDIAVTSAGAKVFTCIYSILGIVNLALAVSLTRETVIEALEASYRQRMNNVRARRKVARWARRVGRRWMGAVTWRLRESGKAVWVWNDEYLVEDEDSHEGDEDYGRLRKARLRIVKTYRILRRSILYLIDRVLPYQGTWEPSDKSPLWDIPHPHGMHLNLEALMESQLEAAAMEAGVPLSDLVPKGFWERREKKRKKERERREKKEKERRNREKGKNRDTGADEEKEPLSRHSPVSSHPTSPSNSSNVTRPSTVRSSSFDQWQFSWFNRLKRIQRAIDPDEVPLTHARLGRMVGVLGSFGIAFSMGRGKEVKCDPSSINTNVNTGAIGGPNSVGPHSNHAGDFDFNYDAAYRQKKLKEEAEEEERKAFIARLVVVWTLFLVFWMVGSGIFMVTENWSFGNALYFCVIAFTTIGYGDFSPHSPAGRSVFVVWALLGVATMTILISVVAEAYTTRYQTVIKSNNKTRELFERAVAGYRTREREKTTNKFEHKNRDELYKQLGAGSSSGIEGLPQNFDVEHRVGVSGSNLQPQPSQGIHSSVQPHHEHHKLQGSFEKLEQLPREILQHARSFQEHIQYFVHGGVHQSHSQNHTQREKEVSVGGKTGILGIVQEASQPSRERQDMPEGLRELLDDILLVDSGVLAATRGLSERLQRLRRIEKEILSDSEARQVLLALSVERTLKKMIEASEEAIELLEEKDKIIRNQGHESSSDI